jgi:AraC-like DNA-binding protein
MLLETGLYSITEVAFRTGFESSSYFSAEFRRMTGRSPKDYRNA